MQKILHYIKFLFALRYIVTSWAYNINSHYEYKYYEINLRCPTRTRLFQPKRF